MVAMACDGPALESGKPGGAAPPDIILITIESLRTDHVGAYGGKSGTRPEVPITPNLDALAREAVVYERAHATTSWTLPSHASLFTGLYPSAHQTRRPLSVLGEDYSTLAEKLRTEGYQTAGVVSGPYLREKYQLTQGIDWLEDSSANPFQPRAHSDVTNAAMERGLLRFVERERTPDRPFFLFAYFWDPHYDFLPPDPYDTLFTNDETQRIDVHRFDTANTIHSGISKPELDFVLAQYDGEIRATDELLGRFFDVLRTRDLWEESLVIVTADHGEEFFDHGEKGHKNNLYVESVKVPLFIKFPKGTGPAPGTRDGRLVSLVDVLPTTLEVVGIGDGTDLDKLDGRSLLAAPDPQRAIFFELLTSWYVQNGAQRDTEVESWWAIQNEDHKLVLRRREIGKPLLELFDIAKDPLERTDIARESPELVAELMSQLFEQSNRANARAAEFEIGGTAELDDAERGRLCALGYLSCEP